MQQLMYLACAAVATVTICCQSTQAAMASEQVIECSYQLCVHYMWATGLKTKAAATAKASVHPSQGQRVTASLVATMLSRESFKAKINCREEKSYDRSLVTLMPCLSWTPQSLPHLPFSSSPTAHPGFRHTPPQHTSSSKRCYNVLQMEVDECLWWEEDSDEGQEIDPLDKLVSGCCCYVCMSQRRTSIRTLCWYEGCSFGL